MEEKIKKSLEWWERLFEVYRTCFTCVGNVPEAEKQLEELEKEIGVKFPPQDDYLDLSLR